MPTYYFNCIDSVQYTVNSSFAFWSFLNHLIFSNIFHLQLVKSVDVESTHGS